MFADVQDRMSVSVDTNVVALLVGRSQDAIGYRRALERIEPVFTFFVQAEILAHDWHASEQPRLDTIMNLARLLPPPSRGAIGEFVLLKRTAVALGLRYGTEREDLWMLAQSRAEELPVLTNDRNAARVARASNMEVMTTLRSIEDDYDRDQRRLASVRSF
jgi:hypothetical protein